jgi:hypothetical protein
MMDLTQLEGKFYMYCPGTVDSSDSVETATHHLVVRPVTKLRLNPARVAARVLQLRPGVNCHEKIDRYVIIGRVAHGAR